MRLGGSARVAVIGAGPGGLAAAKFALAAGFDATVFEAADDLGGQWQTSSVGSGIWPGMTTNTSRGMTAFSDFPPPRDLPLHPRAEQIHDYLRAYAEQFGVVPRIRLNSPVTRVEPGWSVDGESFDALIIASGRFRKPSVPPNLARFDGEVLHAFDYPGAEAFRDRRALVYGNGVSGHEIAADIAMVAPVVSAFRKPRYVLQKVVDGVPSDWQWYTQFSALQRRALPADQFAAQLRQRVVEVAGNPVDFGGLEPDVDIRVAGHSLAQNYLQLVAEGQITCRPAIATVAGRDVTFADGVTETFDAVVCATGYDVDLPYLSDEVGALLGADLTLYQRTLHPDAPTLGVVGQFLAQGPYFSLLELQARWIVGLWSGDIEAPNDTVMRRSLEPSARAVNPHDLFSVTLAEQMGVAPDLRARPALTSALLFGPLLPARYRLDGPGALPDAEARFADQLAAGVRPPVDPASLTALTDMGLPDVAALLTSSPQLPAQGNA
jgi:dimethylaniline monooxygenase (N-oxide forming)